jgi:hypothetical protein
MTNQEEVQVQSAHGDNHRALVAELRALQAADASPEAIAAKAEEVNRAVADMVDAGEVDEEDAWAISAGNNPYIAHSGPPDY